MDVVASDAGGGLWSADKVDIRRNQDGRIPGPVGCGREVDQLGGREVRDGVVRGSGFDGTD